MNVVVQNPSATFAFGRADESGAYASLSGAAASITAAGQRTVGAVILDGATTISKKGVVRTVIRVRVPLFDLVTAGDTATVSGNVAGKSSAGYAQVSLVVTLPNTAGVLCTENDFSARGVPETQGAANAAAVSLAMQLLLNEVCNQGAAASPVLAHGSDLFNLYLLGTDVSDNPVARGLMGLTPISGTDRGITVAAS